MWLTITRGGSKSRIENNRYLRRLARKGDDHLFEDIGLRREDFIDPREERMRNRGWQMW